MASTASPIGGGAVEVVTPGPDKGNDDLPLEMEARDLPTMFLVTVPVRSLREILISAELTADIIVII